MVSHEISALVDGRDAGYNACGAGMPRMMKDCTSLLPSETLLPSPPPQPMGVSTLVAG